MSTHMKLQARQSTTHGWWSQLAMASFLLGALALPLVACGPASLGINKNPPREGLAFPDSGDPDDQIDSLDPAAYVPEVNVTWGELSLPHKVDLRLVWRDQLVLSQQNDERFVLMTTAQKPARDEKVKLSPLLTIPGQLQSLATRNGELLLLYRSKESVVLLKGVVNPSLLIGTAYNQAVEWTAIRTYQVSDENVPLRMQKIGSEILLFGHRDLLRIDWDSNEVIVVPSSLPGPLEAVECHNNVCVALFSNKETPMLLTSKYEWSLIRLAQPLPQDKPEPNKESRRIELQGASLLFQRGKHVFLTCLLGKEALRKWEMADDVKSVAWLNQTLVNIKSARVELGQGDKRALLELPAHLKYLKDNAYTLTRLQSVGGYTLLENDEAPDRFEHYKRYSLAYHPNLPVDTTCQ